MTLHEAIALVLIEFGSPMTPQEIVEIINDRGLYKKATGEEVSPSQVSARVNNYPELFDKIGSEIILRNRSSASLNNLLYHIADILRSKSIYNPDLVLAFLLFYFRLSRLSIGTNYFGNNHFEKEEYFRSGYGEIVKSKIMDAINRFTRHPDFLGYGEELVSTFRKLNDNNLLQIISDLQLFDFSPNSISSEDFGRTFNYFLNSFSGWGRDSGESSTPELVSKYISTLIRVEKDQTFCDPFAGNAGLACELLKYNDGRNCVLQDINPVSVILGKMNLTLHGIGNVQYHQGNTLDLYRTKLEDRQFDYVVTHPPFGLRYKTDDLFTLPLTFLSSGSRGENIHIQLALHLLNHSGKAIILIPDGFLFTNDSGSKEIKRMLVLNDWIEAVHSLPAGSFKPFSSINTSLLILNKNKTEGQRGKIIFKEIGEDEFKYGQPSPSDQAVVSEPEVNYGDKKEIGKSVVIDIEKVVQNDLLLNANRYLNQIELGPEYRIIESVLKNYHSGSVINKKYLNSKEGIPFITIKDLSDSETDFVLAANEISTYVGKMSLVKRESLAWDGAILIAKVGNKLKPTVFSAATSISSAAFSANIIALYPDESLISKEYFINQLNQSYFNQQLNQIRAGSAQVFMQLKDFLQLKIRLPELEEQEKELLKIYRAKDITNRSSRLEREEVEEATQKTLISAIKHEFSNLQVVLAGGITSLRLFIDRKEKEGGSVTWGEKIVNIPEARTISQIISEQESVLKEMGDLFEDMQSLLKLTKSNVKRERIELKSFFREQVDQMDHQLDGVQIFYELTEKQRKERFVTSVDKNLFAKVIKNFLVNSANHGFGSDAVDEKIILFDFAVSEGELWIEITMMNNGKKLPEGFTFDDFISFGGKTGTSSGAGIGGYLMNKIVRFHDGTLELVEYPDGTVLYITSTHSSIDSSAVAVLSKAFIPGVAFKILLPYKD